MAFRPPGGDTPQVDLPPHRHAHQAETGLSLLDQRDVDGELAVPVHEFPGSVQGVDQPVALPVLPLIERRRFRFLRQHGCFRGQPCQRRGNDIVGREIRLGKRRCIGLCTHLEIRLIDVENRRAGPPGHVEKWGDQVFGQRRGRCARHWQGRPVRWGRDYNRRPRAHPRPPREIGVGCGPGRCGTRVRPAGWINGNEVVYLYR